MKLAAFALLALLACAGVALGRQDEALDSILLNELQPVNEPMPRLLAESIAAPGAYGGLDGGMYGEPSSPATIPTTVINPPATGAAAATCFNVLSLLASVIMALAML